MIRTIAKIIIERSLLRGKELPAWVQRRIAHDSQLQQFHFHYRHMLWSLRSDAPAWSRQYEPPVSPRQTPESFTTLKPASPLRNQPVSMRTLAIAAALLLTTSVAAYYVVRTEQSKLESKRESLQMVVLVANAMIDESERMSSTIARSTRSSAESLAAEVGESIAGIPWQAFWDSEQASEPTDDTAVEAESDQHNSRESSN